MALATGQGGRLHELALDQAPVETGVRHETFMATRLRDRAPVHDHNPVGIADRREAMGDDDRGAALHQAVQGLYSPS